MFAVLAAPVAVHMCASATAVCNPIVAHGLLSQWFCLAMCISYIYIYNSCFLLPAPGFSKSLERSMPRRRLLKRRRCQRKKCQEEEVSRARAVKTKRWKEKETLGARDVRRTKRQEMSSE